MNILELLHEARRVGASDVHLVSGRAPMWRIHGYIEPSPAEPLTSDTIRSLIFDLLDDSQRRAFEAAHELCFSLEFGELGFFRFSVAAAMGRVEASIRVGALELPTLGELGLPDVLLEAVRRPSGLFLVTGPTGVGKTTTLNALLASINREERKKIVTIEDPVEYLHPQARSLVVQREVGRDTASFHTGIVHALRQDPDIVCIGEMRDLPTISAALTAAETGHLVLATLHTSSAAQTVNRIVDVFPPAQQTQVRIQLASTIQGVFAQRLLPRADGRGRLLVYELLLANTAARAMIRDGRAHQLNNVIQTGATRGMRQMDTMIREAYAAGDITYDVALGAMNEPDALTSRPLR